MSESENVRDILTAFLIVNEHNKPVIFSSDTSEVNDVINTANSKNIPLKTRKITTNKDRLIAIGKNLFERNLPLEALSDPLKFRNKLIIEWQETFSRISDTGKVDTKISWGKICKKYGVEECSIDEFSAWMLDIRELMSK
jgi:hypothetical protein